MQKGNFQQRITMIEDTENIDKITEIIKRIQQIKMFSLQIDVKISLFVYSFQQNINKVRNAIQNELEVSHSLEMFHNSDLTYEE